MKILYFFIFYFAVFLWSASSVPAGQVPDTGQTTCYDTATEIPCPLPGQPFYGQDAQYPGVARSYTKLDQEAMELPDSAASWSMVRDNVTGLIWECKTNDDSIHDTDENGTWDWAHATFIPVINQEFFGGFDDWRLPSIKELSYLVNRGRVNPAMNAEVFPNIALYYWTSTPAPVCSTGAVGPYYVQTQHGYEYNFIKDGGGAMAVRRETGDTENAFIDNGDGTVTDMTTGLMWQQDGPCEMLDWEESLAYCENLEFAGYTNWRLPNIHELQSIADYTRCDPSIDTFYFPAAASGAYISSTTIVNKPGNAWTVLFDDGSIDFYFGGSKTKPYHVRAVRDISQSLIELNSFSASMRLHTSVLRWSTASEIDNAGFNIYRADADGGSYTKINSELIPARGHPTRGASYEFTDTHGQGRKTASYMLEDIDLRGAATRHGPITAATRLIPAIWR
jgi:hypothetical protein